MSLVGKQTRCYSLAIMEYYSVLGVEPNATQEEIRAAYREWMRLIHPDRNQGNRRAEELAKRINEAYAVLSDPAKRAAYDLASHEDQAQSTRSDAPSGPIPYYYEILDLHNLASQSQIQDQYRQWQEIIASHRASGMPRTEEFARHVNAAYRVLSDPALRAEYDRNPNGTLSEAWPGQRVQWRDWKDWWDNYDPDEFTVNIDLEKVLYGGYASFQVGRTPDMVNIPLGVAHGERFVTTSISGLETKVVINVLQHRIFQRNGPDLLNEITVRQSDVEAARSVPVTTLRGTQISLRLRRDWQNGQRVRCQGQGLPHRNNPAQFGDLIVTIKIVPSTNTTAPASGTTSPHRGSSANAKNPSQRPSQAASVDVPLEKILLFVGIVLAIVLVIAAAIFIVTYIKEILITIGVVAVAGFFLWRWLVNQ